MLFSEKSLTILISGTDGRTRTDKPKRATDFKSVVFANFTTPAALFALFQHFQMRFDTMGDGDPTGVRTRVTAVKGRCPRPLDDRVSQWALKIIYQRTCIKDNILNVIVNHIII